MPIYREETLLCQRCGYQWHPIVKDPKVCARCHSRLWDVLLEETSVEEEARLQ